MNLLPVCLFLVFLALSSLFGERSKREVFSKGPRIMQLYDRLLGIQTPQALVIAHILASFSLIIQLTKHLFDIIQLFCRNLGTDDYG